MITQQLADGVEYSIPAKRSILMMAFLAVWLAGWSVLWTTTLRQLRTELDYSLLVWMAGWTFGGYATLYGFLWQLAGREIVTLTPYALKIRSEIVVFGWTRKYERQTIFNLRVNQLRRKGENRKVVFEYGPKTVRFGEGLSDAEAMEIVADLKSRGVA